MERGGDYKPRSVTHVAGSEYWGISPARKSSVAAYIDRIEASVERRKKEGRAGDGDLCTILDEQPLKILLDPTFSVDRKWVGKTLWVAALNDYFELAAQHGIDLLAMEKPNWLKLAETNEAQWLEKSPLDRFRAIETDRSNLLIKNWKDTLDTIPKGAECLDIGCGSGFFVRAMHERYPSQHWKATDLPREMPTNGTNLDRNNEPWFTPCTLGQPLPYANTSQDVITLNNVLHHVAPEYLDSFLREVRRVLKPRGTLLITEEYKDKRTHFPEDIDAIFWRKDRGHQATANDWGLLLEKNGLFTHRSTKVAGTFGTPGLPVLEACMTFERSELPRAA